MGRGRKCISTEKRRVKSFSLQPSVAQRLDGIPNASEYVNDILAASMTADEGIELDCKLRLTDIKILDLEARLLDAKTEKAKLEERKRNIVKRKDNYIEARMKFLEQYGRQKLNWDNWFSSRVDVLAELDFKTKEEATEWMNEMKKNMTR